MSKPITKKKLLKELFDNGIFKFENIKLRSGETSPYYCNFKNILSIPDLNKNLIDYVVKYINSIDESELSFNHICGIPMGSLSFASAIAYNLNKSQLLCRESKKNYGLKRLIEGEFKIGDKVLLVEDVLTTGGSTLEIYEKLKNQGLEITDVLVLFDRQHEGSLLLEDKKITVHSIFTFKDLINYLESIQADMHVLESLRFFYDKTQKNNILKITESKNELSKKEILRIETELLVSNKLNRKLLKSIQNNKSSLCLSLDVPLWSKAKELLNELSPYICSVKLHIDLYTDWNSNCIQELKELKEKYNLVIIEDSKLIDVPSINQQKLNLSKYKFNEWCDAMTLYWSNYLANEKILNNNGIHPICVMDMNVKNDLINVNLDSIKEFSKSKESSSSKNNFMNNINTIVQQKEFKKYNNLLKLSPGVVCEENDLNYVEKERYRTIENAIIRDKNHIVIIGSNILMADNIVEKCKESAKLSWYYFNLIYKNLLVEFEKQELESKNEIEKLEKNKPKEKQNNMNE